MVAPLPRFSRSVTVVVIVLWIGTVMRHESHCYVSLATSYCFRLTEFKETIFYSVMLVGHQKCIIVLDIKEHRDGVRTGRSDRRPHGPDTVGSRRARQNRESDSDGKAQPPERPAAVVPMAGDQSRALMIEYSVQWQYVECTTSEQLANNNEHYKYLYEYGIINTFEPGSLKVSLQLAKPLVSAV